MRREAGASLWDAAEAARLVREFASGKTESEFQLRPCPSLRDRASVRDFGRGTETGPHIHANKHRNHHHNSNRDSNPDPNPQPTR